MEVYEIAARIGLQNTASAALAMLARDVFKLEGGIKNLSKAFEEMGRGGKLMASGLSIAIGVGIVGALKKAVDHAADLSHELTKIQMLGISPAQFEQARSAAFGMHRQVPGITSADVTRIYGQTYSPLGHDNAIKMLKPLAEFVQVIGSQTGGKPEDYKRAEDNVYNMVRAGHLMGKFMNSITHQVDLEKLQHFLELGERVITATHGRVDARQWFNLAQQGGPALSSMTDQGLLTMAIMAQDMGGYRAGTALSSLFTQFQGGIMTPWRAKRYMELGIIPRDAIQDVTLGGHIIWKKGKEPSSTAFSHTLSEDPLAAVKLLREAMVKHGYPTIEKQVPLLFELLQRITSTRQVHDLLRNLPQIEQERGRVSLGKAGSAALGLQNTQDWFQLQHNFWAAWDEMMMHIGMPVLQKAIPVMKQMTAIVDRIGEIAKADPDKIGRIAEGFAKLGIALIGAGVVGIAAAIGPGGWLVIGIATLVAFNWSTLQKGIDGLNTAIDTLTKFAWDKLVTGFSAFVAGLQKVYDWITSIGGLIHKMSFEGGGGFGGGGGGGKGSWGPSTDPAIIKAAFAGSPYEGQALAVAGSEGLHQYYGDGGTSFGAFQLHTGGGLGDEFQRETGLNLHDPSTSMAQARWVRRWVEKHGGFSPNIWHGMRTPAYHGAHREMTGVVPYHPSHKKQTVEAKLYLDGKLVAANTVGHINRSATHSVQSPAFDGYGMYSGPDRQWATT